MAGQGTSILTLDYNNIQTKIASVFGTGSSTTGYGQSVLSSQVPSTRTVISGLQWANLRSDLLNARTHQTGLDERGNLTDPLPTSVFTASLVGTLLSVSAVSSGTVLVGARITGSGVPANTMITTLGTGNGGIGTYVVNTSTGNTGSIPMTGVTPVKITEADRSAYNTYADTITTYKLITPPAGQATLETYSTATRGTQWNATITNTVTLTWQSADAARFFFNSGGQIRFSASLTPGASNLKNNSWQTMLTNMGTITMNYNSTTYSGTNGTPSSAIGFFQLTSSQQLLFRKSTEQPTYTPNQYNIYANTAAGGAAIIFSIQFADLSAPGGFGVDENVSGTLISLVQGYRASGANVSVAAPAVLSSGP